MHIENSSSNFQIGRSVVLKSVATLAFLTIVYALAMTVIARAFPGLASFRQLGIAPLLACGLTMGCLMLRYLRWRWLLAQHGHRVAFAKGFIAYLSGFALTATPGRVGELVRIRYFGRMGIPSDRVISCFIFEALTDVVTLMILAIPLMARMTGTLYALLFAMLLSGLVCLAATSRFRYHPITWLRRSGRGRSATVVSKVGRGISLITRFADWRITSVSLAIGIVAWSCQSYGLIVIAASLGISIPALTMISIMPAAMLLGAASLVPGGVGTTEAAATLLLHRVGVDLQLAVLAAIAVRATSIWFATLVGLGAIIWMEKMWPRLYSSPPKIEGRQASRRTAL